MRVLVVEDDDDIRLSLVKNFNDQGWIVDQAIDGGEGRYYFTEYRYAVAVVDLGLPVLDGIELIKTIRAAGNHTPILILTARDHWQEKVMGLDAGADDYLAKPFEQAELLARLKALVRRSAGQSCQKIQYGPLVLDSEEQRVWLKDSLLHLTDYEFKLLCFLITNPGEILSKSVLLDQLYDDSTEKDSNTIEVFVRRLRKKIDPHGEYQPIETVRGRGYRFDPKRFDTKL